MGKAICQISLPSDSLAILVCRDDKFIVAKGMTILEQGDVVMILVREADRETIKKNLRIESKRDLMSYWFFRGTK